MASSFSVSKSYSALLAAGYQRHHQPKISFALTKPSFQPQGPTGNQRSIWKVQAQLNEVSIEGSSNSTAAPQDKFEIPLKEEPAEISTAESTVSDALSISVFMTQVSDLVKLVDSRDIMELQLKQFDCELTIRKKEALPQPPPVPPVVMMQPPPQAMHSSQFTSSPVTASAPASPTPSPLALPAPAKTNKSSHPPFMCPMAGTFYRSPGPGEPPFVKVGDKVQKGQVLCIIEAMKLMNEIEVLGASFSGSSFVRVFGDVVMLYIEKGRRTDVASKLFLRKSGPYRIIQHIDDNAYELDISGVRSRAVKLLTQFYDDIPSHPVLPSPGVELTDDILDSRLDVAGHVEFFIRWATQSGAIAEVVAEDGKPVSVGTPLFVIEP
ncbi:hypothetical protein GIB67_000740 [Kingdonia uniflora]|uniref:Biotin carboxyl carrier protein of acetyl-CoA carboxylase n=1 Tax=Kingdonia uniflora TaxID=39325 RepID=A0A7J7NDB2_9MAGN|nr:hypothetical protein GIB67_000740 [Kingdonia uniflora]